MMIVMLCVSSFGSVGVGRDGSSLNGGGMSEVLVDLRQRLRVRLVHVRRHRLDRLRVVAVSRGRLCDRRGPRGEGTHTHRRLRSLPPIRNKLSERAC